MKDAAKSKSGGGGPPARRLLALIRAATEGEVPETLTASLAKFTVEDEQGDGDEGGAEGGGGGGDDPTATSVEEKSAAAAPSPAVGLSAEGQVQAVGLGMELSVILAGFSSTTARVIHADNSPAGAATAKVVVQQLSDPSMGMQKLNVELGVETALGSLASGGSSGGGGGGGNGGNGGGTATTAVAVAEAAAAVKQAAAAARPQPGGVIVFVSTDPTLLLAAADALGFDAVEAKEFEPACGILVEYPQDPSSDEWELHRMLSHE